MTKVNGANIDAYAKLIFDKLDATDGKADKKITASVWNDFARTVGGNYIKEFISEKDAIRSIKAYTNRTDVQKKKAQDSKNEYSIDLKKAKQAKSTIAKIRKKYSNDFSMWEETSPKSARYFFSDKKMLASDKVSEKDKKQFEDAQNVINAFNEKYKDSPMFISTMIE